MEKINNQLTQFIIFVKLFWGIAIISTAIITGTPVKGTAGIIDFGRVKGWRTILNVNKSSHTYKSHEFDKRNLEYSNNSGFPLPFIESSLSAHRCMALLTLKVTRPTILDPNFMAMPIQTQLFANASENESLLEKYAPILYMHSDELFQPISVERMLEYSEVYKKYKKREVWRSKRVYKNKNNKLTLKHLMKRYNKMKYHLQLKKEVVKAIKNNNTSWNWKKDQTIYGREFTAYDESAHKNTVLQYWFFYIYNAWDNQHEGDWEMIQIILDKNNQPERITFSFHYGGQTFQWDDDEVKKEYNHPLVYVTLGGHGNWNKSGNNIWYQKKYTICLECIDKAPGNGDVLYPSTMNVSSKYHYTLIDISDVENMQSRDHWIYWKGYWGKQTQEKMNKIEDFGSSGPSSPPYLDYIDDTDERVRWEKPILWADNPIPSNYNICVSANSKVTIRELEGNIRIPISEHCNTADSRDICDECPNSYIVYSGKDLVFDIYPLDEEEVSLKITRYKKTTGETSGVEFNWLDIPNNGKAAFIFSPEKNPDYEIVIDYDLDGVFDAHSVPNYMEAK